MQTQVLSGADTDDDDWETEPDIPQDFNCIDGWCNARADVQKKSFMAFEESGIFVATCWHCFVLLACNMVKSGEL